MAKKLQYVKLREVLSKVVPSWRYTVSFPEQFTGLIEKIIGQNQ